ncbi:putative nucleotidyltransferase [Pseudovibrio sp. Ad13]|uniref:nucleotidyltransferase domain-containing protein n=1 Tax=Pseudovibrio sp. Ad13 TaxID=989396 RepID=UPI0007AEB66A|nr:nucleotidyltransferase domain-containing protein [Pseudovibrio sp. Ad13]KZK84123.1 putative nucleotidyltransferase [Pseudovibrio sp. Ad13]
MTVLTPFKPSISESMRTRILEQLYKIEADNDVTILFAIESGSRAWGFPSPDSDYDVRFVYTHKLDWYLSLEAGRDVIELPIDDELDISGWEIRKALNLMLKSNPVLLEWLHSPIRYIWRDDICQKLMTLAAEASNTTPAMHHYLNMGMRDLAVIQASQSRLNLKKFFYTLRPALALQWMKQVPGVVPPMNLQQLVNGLSLPDAAIKEIEELIVAKSDLKEKVAATEIPELETLSALIADTFEWAQTVEKPRHFPDTHRAVEAFFRNSIKAD